MKKALLFICLGLCPSFLYAYCTDPRVSNFTKELHSPTIINSELVDCKRNPVRNETIFAVGQRHVKVDKNGYYPIDADIFIVSNLTNHIIARSFFPEMWKDEDTNNLSSITIDTARYYLTKDIRAFGVFASFSGTSHADPAGYSLMSLFISQENKIKTVLKDQQISSDSGEWDTRCAGTYINEKTILSMLPTLSNGYFDIALKKTIQHSKAIEIKGDCQEVNGKSSTQNSVLKFNGKVYK